MKVLIADDEQNIRRALSDLLDLDGIISATAENGLAAQRLLSEEPFDAAVLDLRMPGMTGLELLEWMRESGPLIPVIMISAHGDIQDAVDAMKRGAVDYVTKPFDPEDLHLRIRRAVEDDRLRRSVAPSPDGDTTDQTGAASPSRNEKMRSLMGIARKVAPSDSTVLVTGESGTGKEVLARTIHRLSQRADGPFVPVNLGAVPEQLMESELFGYEKGAFTGAAARKTGVFETAAGGTLFLDEIGEMPLHLQVKLLRVIQDRRVQRVGGTSTIPIDVRILAATNRDLKTAIGAGQFREDLYYRLNVIELHLPALRDRPEDIPDLVGVFLNRIRRRGGPSARGIDPDAIRLLTRYRFPGNIRELENIIERAALLAEHDQLSSRDFAFLGIDDTQIGADTPRSPDLSAEREIPNGAVTLADVEAVAIRRALLRNEGHRERTASELGITRRTLLNKIKEYGISTDS